VAVSAAVTIANWHPKMATLGPANAPVK